MPPKKSAQGWSRKEGKEGVGKADAQKTTLGETLLMCGGGRSQKVMLDDRVQAHQELGEGMKYHSLKLMRLLLQKIGASLLLAASTVHKQDMEEVTEEDIGELNEYIKEINSIKGLLGYGGQWLVMIYSKDPDAQHLHGYVHVSSSIHMLPISTNVYIQYHTGDINEKLGLFISQNECKHTYIEAPAEGLIQRFKEALILGHKWYNIPCTGTELLSQDYVFKLMSFMNSVSTHYIHSLIFDLNKLHAMMMSPGGGVMSVLEEKLTLCFNTIEFTIAEFKDLDKKALSLCQAIIPQVQDVINAVFTGHLFANLETSAFNQYCHALVVMLEEITQMDDDISLYEEDVKKVIQMSPAKISLLLSEWCSDEPFYLFPLPSYCLIEAMNKHLLRINGALLEYASWWTLFIHHDKFHPQDWSPGSASTDMVRAVLAHRSLKMDGHVLAVNKDDDEDSHPKGKGKAKAKVEDDEGDENGGQEDRQVGDDGNDDKGSGRDMSEACDRGEQENADGKIMREQWVDRRAHVKEQAAAHHQLLAKEAETTIKYLNAVEKPLKITLKDFGIPTNCLPKLPSHAPKNIFRGQEFIVHHTYKWVNQVPNSKKQFMWQLACLAIYEHAIVHSYHPQLLFDIVSGTLLL
ncbi:hypothetical protein F5J12DRAFT_786806 [Pisolithus orientalis]|uniref:uncharacterized protein n=1 Tax=Pisolithus orientalis TaxID=936130 RepID=UPI002223FC1D|nr:uncharacterized protein F5J12DRAFT_786806 [Pisolithus orientalis]KAI5988678.1 hypothetical protein F5J12DRAFT_786806 [Pisolithus orientalis]